MSEIKKEYAVYNLERTIAEFPVTQILENMVEVDLLPEPVDKLSLDRQRNVLLEGLAGKTPQDIKPALDLTKRQVPHQVARWATMLMERHVEIGRTIAIQSVTLPQPFVHAYAVGLRAVLPPGSTVEAYGKPTAMRDGRLTGELAEMQKTKSLEALRKQGHTIAFAADSFGTNIAAVEIAKCALLVNFKHDRDSKPGYDQLHWKHDQPNIVHTQRAHRTTTSKYKLSNPDESAALLRWLTRNDPIAQI